MQFSRSYLFVTVAALAAWLLPVSASAQTDTPAEGIAVGVLRLVPSLGVRQAGYDSNIFHEPDSPRGDFVMQIVPATDVHLRIGRGQVDGRSVVGFNYFRQYSNQGGVDAEQQLTLGFAFNRVTPHVGAAWANTKQRQGYDIDVRARRTRVDLTAGVGVRLSPRTEIDASLLGSRESFDDTAFAEGINLQQTLTRRVQGARVALSFAVTPLTSVIVPVTLDRYDFSYDPLRGSTGLEIAPRVEFKPTALVNGSASVGYRRVMPSSGFMRPFAGVIADVDLGYTLRGSTRFGVSVGRDLVYSFRPDFPYFLQTSVGGSVRQRLTASWDVQGMFGRQHLDYRRRLDLLIDAAAARPGPETARTEGWSYGAGLGYRVGRNSRISFEASRAVRNAGGAVGRDFEGWQAGTTVFYGF